LRQIVQQHMQVQGQACQCIRCREVRSSEVKSQDLRLETLVYDTPLSQELFLSYATPEDKLAGFLRLSLPTTDSHPPIDEIAGCAMIREVHIYGPALQLASSSQGEAQHSGLGTSLLEEAYPSSPPWEPGSTTNSGASSAASCT
jgi:elongator complex protein 3